MSNASGVRLSIVVPIYNEGAGLASFHASVVKVVAGYNYELIYCNDGSTDNTNQIVKELTTANPKVKLISLSRNFGKESALAAGISQASGEAIITLDGDGQHPVDLIPEFVTAYQQGAQVVIGVRKSSGSESALKRLQSSLFYRLFNRLSNQKLVPGSTDFRLISKEVRQAFLELKEVDRLTRGLIDWLGFKREFIYFVPKPRTQGTASYSQRKLMTLAVHSMVSLTKAPLYLFGYLGMFITATSFLFGVIVIMEQILLGDPLGWNFTGTAALTIITVFLIGIVLLSQGILSLYISLLYSQSKQRPLFVIDYQSSAGIKRKTDGH